MKDKMIAKIHTEEKEFIGILMKMSPEEIIRAAYELVYKQEIVAVLETLCISEEQAEKILDLPNILDFFYNEWMDWDGDSIRDAIDFALAENLN